MAALIRRFRLEGSGQAIVEFAMVLPVFLLIFAGMADFALLFKSYQTSLNAAREGARMAVLPGYEDEGDYTVPKQRAADYMIAGGLTCTDCVDVNAVDVTLASGGPAQGVEVRVSYTYEFLFIGRIIGLLNGTFQSNLPYEVTTIMRAEVQSSS